MHSVSAFIIYKTQKGNFDIIIQADLNDPQRRSQWLFFTVLASDLSTQDSAESAIMKESTMKDLLQEEKGSSYSYCFRQYKEAAEIRSGKTSIVNKDYISTEAFISGLAVILIELKSNQNK